jgi:hypothetical protein
MTQFTPNGLSIEQLKKDSKKLAKIENIELSKAQNIIARKKAYFSCWNKLISKSNENGKTIEVLKYTDLYLKKQKIAIYEKRPLLSIIAPPGYGKSYILKKILNGIYTNHKKILYTNAEEYNSDEINEIKKKYENQMSFLYQQDFNICTHNPNGKNKNSASFLKHIIDIASEFDVLILEESHRIELTENYRLFEELMSVCSKNEVSVILSGQIYDTSFVDDLIKKHLSACIFIKHQSLNVEMFNLKNHKEANFLSGGIINYKLYYSGHNAAVNTSFKYIERNL